MPLPENQASEIKLSLLDDSVQKQRRQMLVALTLLLVALVLILTKDRDFWFPSAPVIESTSEPVEEIVPEPKAPLAEVSLASQPAGPVHSKVMSHKAPVAAQPSPAAAAPAIINRTVLPPLDVEVVAGDEHRSVQAGSNSVQVDLHPPSAPTQAGSAPPTSPAAGVDVASARVRLSPSAAQILSRPVEPNYPMLAREMKIQGAVVLNALIGRDGNIQNLRVLSGPAILSAAAQEAIRQWRFRPYMQSGQPVETQARVTVNFTIFTQ